MTTAPSVTVSSPVMTRDAVSTSGTPSPRPGRHKHDAAGGADGGRPVIPAPEKDVRIAGGRRAAYLAQMLRVQDGGVPGNLRQAIDTTTAATLRARGSFKWTAPGPGGFGAAVAEMDFGAAPAILDALARLSA